MSSKPQQPSDFNIPKVSGGPSGPQETLGRYEAIQANVKAADARNQATKDFAGEFASLSQTDVAYDFDLDFPFSRCFCS